MFADVRCVEPIFQRLVLDQGYYPDGIWTAPSDAALKRDIELAMAAGFNGARLWRKMPDREPPLKGTSWSHIKLKLQILLGRKFIQFT